MPKFIVLISTNSRPRQITIHAPDAQAARREAEMDGHIVKEVSLAPPEPSAPPRPARDPKADPKDPKFQLLCGLLGIPGLLCLLGATAGGLKWFPGAILLIVVYYGLCKPRKAAHVWNSFNRAGMGFLILMGAIMAVLFYGPVTSGRNPFDTNDSTEIALRITAHVLGFVGLIVLSCVRIKP